MEEVVTPETSETDLRRVSAALWGAVIREGPAPADDTRAALQAIRASLDAARALRFAGDMTGDEQHRREQCAAEAAAQQERALRLWYRGRGLDLALPPAPDGVPSEKRSAFALVRLFAFLAALCSEYPQ